MQQYAGIYLLQIYSKATLEERWCNVTLTCTRGCSYCFCTPDDRCDGHPKHVE